MLDLFMIVLLAAPIVFVIYAIKEYKYLKAGEKIKGAEGIVFIVSGILTVFLLIALLSSSDNNNSTDTSVSNNDTSTEEYTDESDKEETEPIEKKAPESTDNITQDEESTDTEEVKDEDKIYLAIKDGYPYNNYYHSHKCKEYTKFILLDLYGDGCGMDLRNANSLEEVKNIFPDIKPCPECH